MPEMYEIRDVIRSLWGTIDTRIAAQIKRELDNAQVIIDAN